MSKLETANGKLETRNSKFETGSSKPGHRLRSRLSGDFRSSILDFRTRARRYTAGLVGVAIGLLAARPILAQGCALCYNTAAAASGRGITALRHGVLILALPPMAIFGVITFFTVRGRNRFNDEAENFGEEDRAA